MTDKAAHILVAEDDKSVRLVVQQALALLQVYPWPQLSRLVQL